MKIQVNGDKKEFAIDTLYIAELLQLENVDQPDMVSVQRNGEFVNKDDYQTCKIEEGDEIDFLYFMGGGQNSFEF